MTRAQPESTIHLDILRYLRTVLPHAVIHHSPNEFGMAGDGIARQIAKARYLGTVKGWPDLEVLHEGRALFFEVKAPGRKLTVEQSAIGTALQFADCQWAVVRSIDDVRNMLAMWGVRTIESQPQTIVPMPEKWSNVGPMPGDMAERFSWIADIPRDE